LILAITLNNALALSYECKTHQFGEPQTTTLKKLRVRLCEQELQKALTTSVAKLFIIPVLTPQHVRLLFLLFTR